ncbi:hypothetical protein [Kingella potus]|uniref:hypothetical protein n=1 Tax=Kingella potus TaxID=265175 RepID=UPI0011C04C8A
MGVWLRTHPLKSNPRNFYPRFHFMLFSPLQRHRTGKFGSIKKGRLKTRTHVFRRPLPHLPIITALLYNPPASATNKGEPE